MAFLGKKSHRAIVSNSPRAIELDRHSAPEKIVIVTEHPFSGALKYLVVGALAGAGATYFVLKGRGVAAPARPTDAVAEGLSAGGAKSTPRDLMARATAVAGRVKSVAGVVGRVREFASDTIGPAVAVAMSEGKRTAHEVEEEMKHDLEESKRESEAELKANMERKKDDKDA